MGTGKRCSLSLFTWIRVESYGRKQVAPVCPTHEGSSVHGICQEGDTVVVRCEVENHVVNRCTFEEFIAEQEEARTILYLDQAAVTPY